MFERPRELGGLGVLQGIALSPRAEDGSVDFERHFLVEVPRLFPRAGKTDIQVKRLAVKRATSP